VGFEAVVFDVGGVVVGSPLHAIAAYERDLAVAENAINRVVVETGPEGAWSRLERGELRLEAFFPLFEAECAGAGIGVDARELMRRVEAVAAPIPEMLEAIGRIRAAGLRTAALTNNWVADDGGMRALADRFDVVVESAVVGLRKPDPRIYELVCAELRVEPRAAVFLDDIGRNLKPARALGMTTLKVVDPRAALLALEELLDIELQDGS